MKTLLKETSPADAYKMFAMTFTKNDLPQQLDNAFIHFTNYCSSLRTSCITIIEVEANKRMGADYLDVLAVCRLFQSPSILVGMLSDLKNELQLHHHNIVKGKRQREILGDIFQNDLHDSITQAIKLNEAKYAIARQNIYTVEGMINLINVFKKQN